MLASRGLDVEQGLCLSGPTGLIALLGLPQPYGRPSAGYLLLIMDIALQNELDNIRAQLSQKGELARDKGLWVLVGEVLEGRPQSRALPALYVQESCQLL